MKFFAAIIAVVVFVAAVRADVESEDDTFVHIGRSEDQNGKQYDVIGYDVLEFTGKWGEHEVKRIVEFPQKSGCEFIVHGATVSNAFHNPSHVEIVDGGIGQSHIKLQIKAERGHKACVQFFGEKLSKATCV